MDSTGKFNYIFRRSPLLRTLIAIFIISCIIGAIFLFNYKTKAVPVIDSIVPPVGAPGDVIIINGQNFGEIRDMGYVEFAGTKLTASSYISWSDDCIKLVLPTNIQDGLVVVGTKDMRSKPSLFANEVDIPVPIKTVQQSSKPVITSFSSVSTSVGELLTINGNNFGNERNDSKVLFTVDYERKLELAPWTNENMFMENMIEVSDLEGGYESWSNTKIQVRVPDGVWGGVVVVDNGKEKSEPKEISVSRPGIKRYTSKKIYLVQYGADVADVISKEATSITLRCPLPEKTVYQPEVEMTEVNPAPIIMNYQNNMIQQVAQNKGVGGKTAFNQTFVLSVYEINTDVNADKIKSYKNLDTEFMRKALRADSLVRSDTDEVLILVNEIVGKEKNPYKKAKLIYNYMLNNFEIQGRLRKTDANPLELIKKKQGDAYDFAVIYTALLRAADIPALTDAGILVCQDMLTQAHWWTEFYVEGLGWIPVDVALGAGMDYRKWNEGEPVDDANYYFGNLDSHHILFSRGWSQLKPFTENNKIVQHPRSYALQSIWEESSSSTVKYSSYWSVPVIKGVY